MSCNYNWSTKKSKSKRNKIVKPKLQKMRNKNKDCISHKLDNITKSEQELEIEFVTKQISEYWPNIKSKYALKNAVSTLKLKYFDARDEKMKIKILDEIIKEIHYYAFKIDITRKNYFNSISYDVIYEIYKWLNGSDLLSMLQLNKEHNHLLCNKNAASIWKNVCILNEYSKTTEDLEKWNNLSWKRRFEFAYQRRKDFPLFVNKRMTEKGFDILQIYNPTISINKIKEFESKYECMLPKDYILFLTKIGNGGAAESYGCPGILNNQTHENGNNCCEWNEWDRYKHLKYKYPFINTVYQSGYDKVVNPDATDPWDRTEYIIYTEEECKQHLYNGTDPRMRGKIKYPLQGTIAISLDGCGYEKYLVINGIDHGMVYYDARAADGGLIRCQPFLTWYENWIQNVGNVDAEMSEICMPKWIEMVKSSP